MKRSLVLLLACAATAFAQGTLEVISLRHRTADQVIPILRPLLEPGGVMSGQYNQLIVRTSADNLAQIRSALDAIDRPLRRLEISVRFDNAQDAARRDVQGAVRISSEGNSSAAVRIDDTRSLQDERVDQRIQVLEGGQAYISTGQSRPYSQAETGFAVMPRVSGSNVFLDIGAQQEAFVRGGAVQGQRAVSTVSARLGEWFELGGASSSSSRSEGGMLSSRDRTATGDRRIWVKVEEIR